MFAVLSFITLHFSIYCILKIHILSLQALLELFLGIKPVITGDEIRPNEANLLMMNHRTRLDWMYLWQLLVRQSGVKTEKIILKSMLKHIPGAGGWFHKGLRGLQMCTDLNDNGHVHTDTDKHFDYIFI